MVVVVDVRMLKMVRSMTEIEMGVDEWRMRRKVTRILRNFWR
jgi:hypothetical protein